MTDNQSESESQVAPGPRAGADPEQDRQEYFEELASVKDSILEGVITYW
ncbi:hypothetical protein [Streptomyces sp. NPDC051569]